MARTYKKNKDEKTKKQKQYSKKKNKKININKIDFENIEEYYDYKK